MYSKASVQDVNIGDEVMLLKDDYAGLVKGMLGKVINIDYDNQFITVEWEPRNYKEQKKPVVDGFSEDELKHLAFYE